MNERWLADEQSGFSSKALPPLWFRSQTSVAQTWACTSCASSSEEPALGVLWVPVLMLYVGLRRSTYVLSGKSCLGVCGSLVRGQDSQRENTSRSGHGFLSFYGCQNRTCLRCIYGFGCKRLLDEISGGRQRLGLPGFCIVCGLRT